MVQVNLCHGTGIMHQPPQVASMATADMNSGCMPECNRTQLLQSGSKYTHFHFEKPAPIFRQLWYLPTQDLCQQVVSQSPEIVGEVVQQGSDCLGRGVGARGGRGEGSVENSLNKAQNLKWNGINSMSISIKLGVSFTLLIYITHLLTSGECWERGDHCTSEYQRMITSEIAMIVLFDSQEHVCMGARGHGHYSAWKACFQVVPIQHNKHCISTDKSCQHNVRLSHS